MMVKPIYLYVDVSEIVKSALSEQIKEASNLFIITEYDVLMAHLAEALVRGGYSDFRPTSSDGVPFFEDNVFSTIEDEVYDQLINTFPPEQLSDLEECYELDSIEYKNHNLSFPLPKEITVDMLPSTTAFIYKFKRP